MMNLERMLGWFSTIRKAYADNLDLRYDGYKLSPNEISILIMLSSNKNIDTGGQICILLGVSKGLVSRSIDSLIAHGLLIKRKDEFDKRITHIQISKEAEPFIKEMRSQLKNINEKVYKDIDKEELEQMESTILKIIDRFEKLEESNNERKQK